MPKATGKAIKLLYGRGEPVVNAEAKKASLHAFSSEGVEVVGLGTRITVHRDVGDTFNLQIAPLPTGAQIILDTDQGTFEKTARVLIGEIEITLTVEKPEKSGTK